MDRRLQYWVQKLARSPTWLVSLLAGHDQPAQDLALAAIHCCPVSALALGMNDVGRLGGNSDELGAFTSSTRLPRDRAASAHRGAHPDAASCRSRHSALRSNNGGAVGLRNQRASSSGTLLDMVMACSHHLRQLSITRWSRAVSADRISRMEGATGWH